MLILQNILNKLYNFRHLSKKEISHIFSMIINKKVNHSQLVAILISLKMKGIHTEEIIGAVNTIRNYTNSKIYNITSSKNIISDIVGTGGDNLHTLNISTSSAFIAASCGIKIAKHINSCVSSTAGSADIISLLGYPLNHSFIDAQKLLNNYNLCFLFAQKYYSFFSDIMAVRKQLKTYTIFNIVGPLINPFQPKIILIGVSDPRLLKPMIYTLKYLQYYRAAVVYCRGMDEISLHNDTIVFELYNQKIHNYILTPKSFGLNYISIKDLIGISIKDNTKKLIQLLKGQCQNISYINTVAANVAFLLKLNGYDNLIANTRLAIDQIYSGSSYNYIAELINQGYIKNHYV
ncbi:anthranilate phosphoribosyltransferase [Enterobacteriaceae endosymbiont of Neohaemonia nigricornis]|uniref:anthranilate phosphoribosyltransferase n=1 Tax=Enterobacteriaceae endosymbiont of Neohaemonia nigricornis TaxID=2675792 RepID=UPI001449EEC2|nr:anthranilate phosphoribosyltransferase [Enterobacteriaceae endosymbiont of Neohaemonia nigricornis]QJC30297.1 anthranilate phosphoribosyltransferase [Enterobacteriaceae endosymbiont of Neohaemonia nigricornis]